MPDLDSLAAAPVSPVSMEAAPAVAPAVAPIIARPVPTDSVNIPSSHTLSASGRPAVTPAHAALTRAIGLGCSSSLPGLGADADFSLHLTQPGESEQAAIWIDPMTLSGPFGLVQFSDGGRLVRVLCGIDFGEKTVDDDARSSWLHAAILGRLLDTPLACADRIARSDTSMIGEFVALRVVIRSASHAFSMIARATPAAWLAFLARSTWTREQRPAHERLATPLDVPVLVAQHRCALQTVRDLMVGDIVLPDTANFLCGGEGSIQVGGLRMRVQYQGPRSLRIIEMETHMEYSEPQERGAAPDEGQIISDESSPTDSQMQSAPAIDREQAFNDLPVTLDFELGHLRMSLGELQTLGPGAVLSVEGGSPASVAIVSSGRPLGRGEIVDVGGQLGIRIIQWGVAL